MESVIISECAACFTLELVTPETKGRGLQWLAQINSLLDY